MKPQDMQRYAKVVSDVINATEENGEDLNADYETLRNAIDHDTIADLSGDKLKAIRIIFKPEPISTKITSTSSSRWPFRSNYWADTRC